MKNNNILNNLPSQIKLDIGKCKIHLELDKKSHRGKNNLSDIFWYVYKIKNNNELEIAYDNICLSLFKITESIRIEASKNIIANEVSKSKTKRPHIDYKSGNIHPSKEYVENQNDGKIKQLVLCNGLGPCTNEQVNTDFYIYKNSPRQSGSKVHKACYFPPIDNNTNLQDNWRYKLLKKIWENIKMEIIQFEDSIQIYIVVYIFSLQEYTEYKNSANLYNILFRLGSNINCYTNRECFLIKDFRSRLTGAKIVNNRQTTFLACKKFCVFITFDKNTNTISGTVFHI